jgi:hypothetical protein
MFDTILSGCDDIRQYPSKWFGSQCEVMRVPDMEVASCVQTIHTILVVNAGHVPHKEMTNQYPTTWFFMSPLIVLHHAPGILDDTLLRQ